MKKALITIFCLLNLFLAQAQVPCVPNQLYKDTLAGVYPLPETDFSVNGGINKPACLGKPYSFTFTVKVTDTIYAFIFGQVRAVTLDSINITKTNAIENLPVGLTYACNPPSCNYTKNTLGCLVISGTPTNVNPVRKYDLFIKGKVYSPLLLGVGILDGYDVTFPGDVAPGKYSITLLANDDPKCTASATRDLSDEITDLSLSPNPSNVSSTVFIDAKMNGSYSFDVYNLLGKSVLHRPLSIEAGLNKIELNTESLSNGVYIYALSKGNQVSTGKLIVHK